MDRMLEPAATTAGRFVTVGTSTIADRRRPRFFLPHVHRLRAIAILCIVTVHCIGAFQWHDHPLTGALLREMFDNSSVLFLFVAGYLFQHLSRGFTYEGYLRKKASNVLLPYLIIATPGILLAVLYRADLYATHPDLRGHPLAYLVTWLYVNGGATVNPALWFVPVILLFYAAAPVFMQFEKHPRLYMLLWVLIPLSLLAHRPIYDGGHNLEFLLYFFSAYVLGMYCSHRGAQALRLMRRHLPLLVAAFVAILLGHTFLAADTLQPPPPRLPKRRRHRLQNHHPRIRHHRQRPRAAPRIAFQSPHRT